MNRFWEEHKALVEQRASWGWWLMGSWFGMGLSIVAAFGLPFAIMAVFPEWIDAQPSAELARQVTTLSSACGGVFIISLVAMLVTSSRCSALDRKVRAAKRYAELFDKYNDTKIVNDIVAGQVWQGATEEMVLDSWGKPASIDTKVLKTKTKEIWKYGRTGKGRYANRVTIENGEVVGWDINRG